MGQSTSKMHASTFPFIAFFLKNVDLDFKCFGTKKNFFILVSWNWKCGKIILNSVYIVYIQYHGWQSIRPHLLQSFPCSRQSINLYHLHGAQPIRILLSMILFSLFLARGKGKRRREPPPLSALLFHFFLKGGLPFYSTQGSVQPQEAEVRCIRTWLFLAPLMLIHRTRFNGKN